MKKIKKVISLCLALFMCLSLLPTNIFAATAEKVYMIDLPRSADPNKSGWGHPALNLLNGWTMDAADTYAAKAVGSYEGTVAYCIEPGISLYTGDALSVKGEDYWDNYPDMNPQLTPDQIKRYVGRIMQYGYTSTNNLNWRSDIESHAGAMAAQIATQMVIWEVICGERDISFNHINAADAGYSNVMDLIQPGHPLRWQIYEHYNRIEDQVKRHVMLPSFMSRSLSSTDTFELSYNGSYYSLELTDTNSVLQNYKFTSNNPDVYFINDGYHLTIQSPIAFQEPISISAEKIDGQRKGIITWTDGVISSSHNGQIQDMVSFTENIIDPVQGFMNIKIGTGELTICKDSPDDNLIENVYFHIKGPSIDETISTDSTGCFSRANLLAGEYVITEYTSPLYEPQPAQEVTIVAGGSSVLHFQNKLKRGWLTVQKAAKTISSKD